jgi:hypothetical protein
LFRLGEQHVSRSNFVSDAWYEQEADSFAAELLMPEAAFLEEMRRRGLGLMAIKAFAEVFQTSLTSTAIRYAQLTPDPVAVVVSEQGLVCYCFASSCMRRIRADYLPKGSPLPPSSETFRMVRAARSEAEGTSYLSAWFSNPVRELRFDEDVIDLGSYGKVLTVLHVREVSDPESDEDEDAEEGDHFTPDGKRYRW